MPVEIFKCFIASPNDTQAERDACDKVFAEINSSLGELLNFRVESLRWEKNVRPSFGEDGQDVINKQIGDKYHIFIGIMFKKFGSKTMRAGSGTEEEFNIAYDRYIKKEDVEIMFYFNNEPVNIRSVDTKQLDKVNKFRGKVAKLGGLYAEYNGASDFAEKLKNHLFDFFKEKKSPVNSILENNLSVDGNQGNSLNKLSVQGVLDRRLKDALHNFSDQPIVWVEPILSGKNQISRDPNDNFESRIEVDDFIDNTRYAFVQAPPQFGLTCLSHFLVKRAWEKNKIWIYIDSQKVKLKNVIKSIYAEANSMGVASNGRIDCIVIDSCIDYDADCVKLANNITDGFPGIPVVIMRTNNDNGFRKESDDLKLKAKFDIIHLLALPRTEIRKIVSAYNSFVNIAEEDKLLSKVVSDLDVLNIHRTPLNCLTLLKASEGSFDESPVNRTRLLELVLIALFDLVEVPRYKSKPDVKDCEYALGRFCERIIKTDEYTFTREYFLSELKSFCFEKLIDLDVDVMFDVLEMNSIIVQTGLNFRFRFSYWIFYFAAKRMHVNTEFSDYIFKDNRYTSFPEIIEFYTGIDRNRNDALNILMKNLSEIRAIVHDKVGLPADMNPYHLAKWNPSEEAINKMQKELGDDVSNSSLPDVIKDQHADKTYDQNKPYNQAVSIVMRDYYLLALMNQISASCRALRNSDYAEADIKRDMLKEIMKGWEEVCKVLLAISPIIASKGIASFGGAAFLLANGHDASIEDRFFGLIEAMPTNVVRLFKDDLFSNKIGPLLYDHIRNEDNELRKHHLIIFLASERPNGWKAEVEKYIISISMNSYYLCDILDVMQIQYKYAYTSDATANDLVYLMKMCLAKHKYRETKPGLDKLKKIPNSALPKRSSNIEDDN